VKSKLANRSDRQAAGRNRSGRRGRRSPAGRGRTQLAPSRQDQGHLEFEKLVHECAEQTGTGVVTFWEAQQLIRLGVKGIVSPPLAVPGFFGQSFATYALAPMCCAQLLEQWHSAQLNVGPGALIHEFRTLDIVSVLLLAAQEWTEQNRR